MNRRIYAAPAFAGLIALPVAGLAALYLMDTSPFGFDAGRTGGGKTPATVKESVGPAGRRFVT